ncbi:hypothetical protein F5X97DRAFT_88018 [Nemania serpens]|nr:hypothetical protein F5X97DRAFT_88018 [Nemania serpens]
MIGEGEDRTVVTVSILLACQLVPTPVPSSTPLTVVTFDSDAAFVERQSQGALGDLWDFSCTWQLIASMSLAMRRALVVHTGQICLVSGSTTDGLSGLVPFLFGNLPSITWGDSLPYGMSASGAAGLCCATHQPAVLLQGLPSSPPWLPEQHSGEQGPGCCDLRLWDTCIMNACYALSACTTVQPHGCDLFQRFPSPCRSIALSSPTPFSNLESRWATLVPQRLA